MDVAAEILTYHGWRPTPSAQALHTFWETYPWVQPMYEIEGMHAYRDPEFSGLIDCPKCDRCRVARTNTIRRTYDPNYDEEAAWDLWALEVL